MSEDTPAVLFVCVHNAGRSQMAAALLDRYAQGRVQVRSGGSEPADQLNPAVVEAANVVVTMGCGDACPIYPDKRYEDWAIEDPAGKNLATVRAVRNDIDQRVKGLLAEIIGSAG